jgi:hypothetical protein
MKLERVEAIYNELESLVIELSPDPGARGPAYLQDLISRTRGYLNKTSLFHHEIHREQHLLERELIAREAAYELSSDTLLADDHRVTRLPNIEDRRAMISNLLKDEKILILDLKRSIRELGFVEKVVKHRHKELDNTMAALRMQKSLMDTEARTGAFYGDETDTSRNKGAPSRTFSDIDEDELASLLGGDISDLVTGAVESAVEEEPTPPPQPVVVAPVIEPKAQESEEPEDPDIAKFLDGDDDLDAILNSL